MGATRKHTWLDPNKDQSQHLIEGTPFEKLPTANWDSASDSHRDDPMGAVTDGVGDGQFLPDALSARKTGDRKLVSAINDDYQDLGGIGGDKPVDLNFAMSSGPGDAHFTYGGAFGIPASREDKEAGEHD